MIKKILSKRKTMITIKSIILLKMNHINLPISLI